MILEKSFKEIFKAAVNRFRQQKLIFEHLMDRYTIAKTNSSDMTIYDLERSYESSILEKLRDYCRALFLEYLDNILQFELKKEFNFTEEPWWDNDIIKCDKRKE